MEQRIIDRQEINNIFEDMKQNELKNKVIGMQRLGNKVEGRKRPIRVEFQTAWDRETACRNARELKNSIRFKNIASICRDKIKIDRERDRAQYLERKRTQNTTNDTGHESRPINTNRTEVNTGETGIRSETGVTEEQIGRLLIDSRDGITPIANGDLLHPQVVEERNGT